VKRKTIEIIHVGKYAAEVPIELIEDETGWSPYLSPEDAYKLDDVRKALKEGDLKAAVTYARVVELLPISA
jgi:hypothetical protein